MFQYSDVYFVYLYQAGCVYSANILLFLLPGCGAYIDFANTQLLVPLLCQYSAITCTKNEWVYPANTLLWLLPDSIHLLC
jgi:hypothetical protein